MSNDIVPNLRKKLAAIRREVHNVEKRGRNEFHKYDYVQAADIAGILGTQLAEANVAVGRRNVKVTRSEATTTKGNKETVVEIECEYGLLDADTDESIWYGAYGEGRDAGDKAGYKAFTGAFKYFLIQAFMLATGDDPEDDGESKRPVHTNGAAAHEVPITPTEVLILTERLESQNVESEKFLEFFKVQSETELTLPQYQRAMRMLDQRADAAKHAAAKQTPSAGAPAQDRIAAGVAVISEAQGKRLYAIAKGNRAVLDKVLAANGYSHSKEIARGPVYETICAQVEEELRNQPVSDEDIPF